MRQVRAVTHEQEVAKEPRFEFGKNYQGLLDLITEDRIAQAEASLKRNLQVQSLRGKTFLDIGAGSGLFSLAAWRLGANVHSFDIDVQCVACAAELKGRFCPDAERWVVEQGSVLDSAYIESVGTFDITYAWGVLHHTGALWEALENAIRTVAPSGQLFVSVANDQGKMSQHWKRIKQAYNQLPPRWRFLVRWYVIARLNWRGFIKDSLRGDPLRTWRAYPHGKQRGMARWIDVVDWAGAYPFEVAKPEEVFGFCRCRGLVLEHLKTCRGSHGNNEFVFHRAESVL